MFLGKMENGANALDTLNVLKPIQYLYIIGDVDTNVPYINSLSPMDVYNALSSVRVTVRHTNSQTSHTRELIPSMDLLSLMQICTIEEGFANITPYQSITSDNDTYGIRFELPIKLSPEGAVALNNNSYLSCDFRVATSPTGAVRKVNKFEVRGIEGKSVNASRVMLYTRYFIPKGELQRQFDFTTQKALYIDHFNSSLESILLPCVSGATPIYEPTELRAISRLQNDLVAVGDDCYCPVTMSTGEKHNLFLNFGGSTLTKIVVTDKEMRRQVLSMTVKVDGEKSYTFYTADFYDINSGALVNNIQ